MQSRTKVWPSLIYCNIHIYVETAVMSACITCIKKTIMLWFATVQRWWMPHFDRGMDKLVNKWGSASWDLYSLMYMVIIIYALHYSESVVFLWESSVVTGSLALCFIIVWAEANGTWHFKDYFKCSQGTICVLLKS